MRANECELSKKTTNLISLFIISTDIKDAINKTRESTRKLTNWEKENGINNPAVVELPECPREILRRVGVGPGPHELEVNLPQYWGLWTATELATWFGVW